MTKPVFLRQQINTRGLGAVSTKQDVTGHVHFDMSHVDVNTTFWTLHCKGRESW